LKYQAAAGADAWNQAQIVREAVNAEA